MWRISRSNSIIRWQDYRVSASRLAESNFRYTQDRRAAQDKIVAPLSRQERLEFMRMMHKLVQLNNNHSRVPLRLPLNATVPDKSLLFS
jgi:hypothetical protein